MALQFILFNFANYSPSIAMELKVFLKLQAAGINFEKLLGWIVLFSKTLFSICFNLLQFCPSVASVVSVVLF